MSAELKPCPFCGHEADHVHVYAGEEIVRCGNEACPASPMSGGETEDEVFAAWNTRAPQAAPELSTASRPEAVTKVYLVATGETHEGQETYTRHDVRPPLCDAEVLYSASPSPIIANGIMALLASYLMDVFIEEDERERWETWLTARFAVMPDDAMAPPLIDAMLSALAARSAPGLALTDEQNGGNS